MDVTPNPAPAHATTRLRTAARYWEPRRLAYNAILALVCAEWVLATWPHFRPAFAWATLPPLAALALMANLCYSAAYLVDIPLQRTAAARLWHRARTALFVAGTLFGILLANYWISDEIYPFVH
jgi:hypothetical protein